MLNPFNRSGSPHTLAVGMTGVKMGDRFAQVGCADGGRLGAVAAKVGLSGRAAAAVADERSAARARKGAEQAGVLVEVEIAPPTRLPFDDGAFDVVVVDDTGAAIGSLAPPDRSAAIGELARILRGGGRAMIIGEAPASGMRAVLARSGSAPSFAASGDASRALQAGGFASVRVLAEREGLVFVEGIKPRA
jgi:SAM-dependent methyltransferase